MVGFAARDDASNVPKAPAPGWRQFSAVAFFRDKNIKSMVFHHSFGRKQRGVPTQLQVTCLIFSDTAPARNGSRKIQNVGRCRQQGPGNQEFGNS